ncbi:SGNH/GDSL hydrolase family protein [Algoriphagus sp. H41]|uniref:SGNH/GDSL hydrolase family protein n=1 Tax=Algoriphagus oliviformis TaxID=2811231 RepID=A0ABS3BZC5_9BACT|nr:SGNH/GDSL hydrolase family protein [Algoriphagus oliviformis]MBN7810208.1 SGNH/GDSL hydrolase family protein [Algoriphagus oliviformis]
MQISKIFWTVLFAVGIQLWAFPQEYPLPKDSQRIVFLGNSITYQGTFISYIDTYLTLRYPEKAYEIINLGLPSETVSGLSEPNHADGKFPRPDLRERMERVLAHTQPDLVIANYGMNDGIYLPLDDDRFDKFKEGMDWMHRAVENSGADIIHVTPPVYDERKGVAYANVLDIYSDWLVSQRYTKEWKVIDLHWPMRKALEDQRAKDPDFAFAQDGVHPNEAGHFLMAKEVLLGLGENVENANTIEELLTDFPEGVKVLQLVQQRQVILRDAWLRQTGHQRPGLAEGMPMEKATQALVKIDAEIEKLLVLK